MNVIEVQIGNAPVIAEKIRVTLIEPGAMATLAEMRPAMYPEQIEVTVELGAFEAPSASGGMLLSLQPIPVKAAVSPEEAKKAAEAAPAAPEPAKAAPAVAPAGEPPKAEPAKGKKGKGDAKKKKKTESDEPWDEDEPE